MEYTIIINGRSYDLPKKTVSVMEKMDSVLKVDNLRIKARQKFEKIHEFVKDMIGAENAKEAFGSDPGILRNLIWNQCISWRKYRKRVYVCSSTCGCSNPGGIKFNCNNRPFFRNAEDGQGACNHSKTAGGRRSWKCLRDLFG